MKLKELQFNFLQYLQGKPYSESLFDELDSESIHDSLTIYRNNSLSALDESLANQYQALKKYLGVEEFALSTKQSLEKYPSRSGNLDDYSKVFLDYFINVNSDKLACDIAILDYTYWNIYISRDDKYKAVKDFSNINIDDYPRVVLIPSHSLRLIKINNYDSLEIWHELFHHRKISIDRKTNYILGYRHELNSMFEYITEGEFNFLKQIRMKKNLSNIFEYMIKEKEENNFSIYLPKYINKKIITSFTLN